MVGWLRITSDVSHGHYQYAETSHVQLTDEHNAQYYSSANDSLKRLSFSSVQGNQALYARLDGSSIVLPNTNQKIGNSRIGEEFYVAD